MKIETMRVKPWGTGQGDHVTINVCDFDPATHTALDAGAGVAPAAVAKAAQADEPKAAPVAPKGKPGRKPGRKVAG